MPGISASELKNLLKNDPADVCLIDVREYPEFSEIRVRGSKNLPMGSLTAEGEGIDWSKTVVFVCRSGARSGRVVQAYAEMGKPALNLE